ncbi:iron/zinc/copper transport system substrate-binding protein [Carnobacterium iners]|uniref:Iron/zinc/copper transport system substrate-binding protein n=3 Tax=Carnobacterium iners TaxID=1073423 RepID=A0A1X7MPY8_9LACT|nr:metal ABC transporter substrate-binding protein [Carnobacterium iners]SMH26755.1 iron/zinc/copper transport system substrate-binding protein [Carnobacterium iners]
MKKIKLILALLTLVVFIAACGNDEAVESGKLQVVATNSILADMIKNVAGDNIELHSIVPVGTDPHQYEVLPADIEKSTDSDVIFYNGLNLETGGDGWFVNLMETSKKIEGEDYFSTSEGVQPMFLTSAGQESEQDPHAWLDISNGIQYVKNITEVLMEKDPDNKADYQNNSDAYIEKLTALDTKAKKEFEDIPEDQKLLVTSEGAFKYFSAAYGVTGDYIWEINTDSQGTPEQMSTIIDTIRESKVPSLFVETSVDNRSMQSVSKETGVPIYETLFTDSVAKEGENGDSYYDMMEWNLTKIHEGLNK